MSASINLESISKKTSVLSTLVGFVISVVSGLAIGYSFYYTTIFTQAEQGRVMNELKIDVAKINDKINTTTVSTSVSTAEINFMKERVTRIESTINQMDDKIDRLLEQTKDKP